MEDASNAVADVHTEPPGSWLAPVPLWQRWVKLAWRMGIASAVGAWVCYEKVQSNAPEPGLLMGFGIFALGYYFGMRAYRVREHRVFDTLELRYTHAQRAKRAARWFVPGLCLLAIIWGVQLDSGQFAADWWYAWPALFPLLVGVGLYRLRSERVLSAKGQYAREQIEAAQRQVSEQRMARLEAFAWSAPVRYVGAAGCVYVAYLLAVEYAGKNTGWFALGFLVAAFILAYELGIWLVVIGVLCGVGWVLFTGVSALPVSAAVVIGALIIAAAVRKR